MEEERLYDVYEDIKILEEQIKSSRNLFEDIGSHTYLKENTMKPIEHLIEAYRKVKEENNIIKENLDYRVRYCNKLEKDLYGENAEIEITNIEKKYFIPKSKIKEKIEELEKERKAPITIQWEMEDMIEAKIQVLQELLEEE